jgi:uncharacterized protein (DUF433 family)
MYLMSTKRIAVDEKILFGKPHIKGTRISVEQVLASLAQGMTHEELFDEFNLSKEDIQACMEYASKSVSGTHYLDASGNAYA